MVIFHSSLLSYNLLCSIKGDTGGEPRVRVPALLLLPAWLLCVWLCPSPLGGFPNLPASSSFEGLGLLGHPSWLLGFCFHCASLLLAGPRGFHGHLEVPWGLTQGPRTIKALSCSLMGPPPSCCPTRAPGPGPQPPATRFPSGLHGQGLLCGEGQHDAGGLAQQVEGLGCLQCAPGDPTLVREGQPSSLCLAESPGLGRTWLGCHSPVYPRPCACACFAPPLLGPQCLPCLPFCLHLLSSLPQTCGGSAPRL